MVKTLPSTAGGTGLIPVWGTNIPHKKVPSDYPMRTCLSLSSMILIFLKSLIRYFVECCSVWVSLLFFHSVLVIMHFGKDTLRVLYPSQGMVLVDT